MDKCDQHQHDAIIGQYMFCNIAIIDKKERENDIDEKTTP
jgi:hypothetical protein